MQSQWNVSVSILHVFNKKNLTNQILQKCLFNPGTHNQKTEVEEKKRQVTPTKSCSMINCKNIRIYVLTWTALYLFFALWLITKNVSMQMRLYTSITNSIELVMDLMKRTEATDKLHHVIYKSFFFCAYRVGHVVW